MWNYEKRLQYPVNITTPNAKLASVIISQYGGPDGEMGASMRYLSQRYTMPYKQGQAVLTNASVNVFLKQNATDIDDVAAVFKLSDGEKNFL